MACSTLVWKSVQQQCTEINDIIWANLRKINFRSGMCQRNVYDYMSRMDQLFSSVSCIRAKLEVFFAPWSFPPFEFCCGECLDPASAPTRGFLLAPASAPTPGFLLAPSEVLAAPANRLSNASLLLAENLKETLGQRNENKDNLLCI